MNIRMGNQRPEMLCKVALSGNGQALVTKEQNQKFIERRLDVFKLDGIEISGKIDACYDSPQCAANR